MEGRGRNVNEPAFCALPSLKIIFVFYLKLVTQWSSIIYSIYQAITLKEVKN